jgi:molecular chaperone DnaK (HSP70)
MGSTERRLTLLLLVFTIVSSWIVDVTYGYYYRSVPVRLVKVFPKSPMCGRQGRVIQQYAHTSSSDPGRPGLLQKLYQAQSKRAEKTKTIPASAKCEPESVIISVGIDLGTTYSAISVFNATNRTPNILPLNNDQGTRQRTTIMPSLVSIQRDADANAPVVVVGDAAKKYLVSDPLNTFASFKRFMGKTYADLVEDIQERSLYKAHLHKFPVQVQTWLSSAKLKRNKSMRQADEKLINPLDPVHFACPNARGGTISPVELSAEIVKYLVTMAKTRLQAAYAHNSTASIVVKNAVITVPAYFLPSQCRATEEAAKLAGIHKVVLIREPEAIALAYGLPQTHPQIVLVFDIGGGTLDISVLEVGQGLVEVLATTGDAHLGGDDFNQVIVAWLLSCFQSQFSNAVRTSLESNLTAMHELLLEAERIKLELSTCSQVLANISLYVNSSSSVSAVDIVRCTEALSRRAFDKLCAPLCSRMLKPLREAALLAGVNLPGETCSHGHNDDSLYSNGLHEDKDEDGTLEWDEADAVDIVEEEPVQHPQTARQALTRMDEEELTDLAIVAKAREKMSKYRRNEFKSATKSLYQEKKRLNNEVIRRTGSEGDSVSSGTMNTRGGGGKIHKFPGGQKIHRAILAGGASRIPMVRKMLSGMLGKDIPIGVQVAGKALIDPDECVAAGAAVMCGILDGHVEDMNVVSAWQASVYRILDQISEEDFTDDETEDGSGG